MNQEIRAQFTLSRFSAGDALQFIMANGTKQKECHNKANDADTAAATSPEEALPGLSKLVHLQVKHFDDEKMHHYDSYDPLCVVRRAESESHEQWCAHTQTACALAKNTVSAVLQQRIEIRVRRYGDALLHLANTSENEETEEGSTAMASDSAAASPNFGASELGDDSGALKPLEEKAEGDEGSEEDEEEIETYLLKHMGFATETATAWLQRRYLRCCELMGVRTSVVVSHRLSQCVQPCFTGTIGSFFAAQKNASPLSPLPVTQMPTHPKAAQSWMTFTETLVLLRELCAVPFEVNPDFHGCGDIGKQTRHFVAVMGLLEGCRYTVVSLNLSNTGLTDRELRVLCLFCHAHLRRLRVLDLSNNSGVTDKMALRLKKMAASLPLLTRLVLHGTSVGQGTLRVVERLLCRKVL